MDHVAILRKDWKLIPKILSGDKKIESRWYMAKFAPWDRIKIGETIYFKDSGSKITAKATVDKIIQYDNYSRQELKKIIDTWHGKGGICFVNAKENIFEWAKTRKYCILIFLKDPQQIKPFDIDKKGFGNAAA